MNKGVLEVKLKSSPRKLTDTYRLVCNTSSTRGVTCGTGSIYPSGTLGFDERVVYTNKLTHSVTCRETNIKAIRLLNRIKIGIQKFTIGS